MTLAYSEHMDVTNKIIVYLIGACFLIAYLLAEIIYLIL